MGIELMTQHLQGRHDILICSFFLQIKVEADDTRQGEEYDDYDDGGRGDDEDDDDEDAPSAPKRIKTQDSGDEDFKPTNLVESAMEDTSDINGQQGGSNRKSKERQ